MTQNKARRRGRRTYEGGLRLSAARRACARPTQTQDTYQVVYNYAADAGGGSQTFAQGDTWRAALLGTVAAGALMFGYGRTARAQVVPRDAQCPVAGDTVNCTGDLSAGVEVDGSYTTLNVNTLTANIAPASGVDGINFTSEDNITITSDTTDGPGGPFAIITTGDDARGIYAYSYDGKVTVTQTGDITTKGDDAEGIYAYAWDGNLTVTQTGDITTKGDDAEGIYAYAYGKVTVTQTGDITTKGDDAEGIHAYAWDGNLTVTQTGDITTKGYDAEGIYAYADGKVTVTQTGDITTKGDDAEGIYALAYGKVTVTQTGDITTKGDDAEGIYAFSWDGKVTVTQTGDITTKGKNAAGIFASADGAITVESTGDVTSKKSDAIYARGGTSIDITLHSGTISGGDDGVEFVDGATNTLTNYASISGGANAIRGGTGDETVDNFGTVTGNVDLGDGDNAFNNWTGGVFNSGPMADLGGGLFTNEGNLSPGGVGTVQTTALTGNLVQTDTGTFMVDLDLAGSTADRVNATGTAALDGTVVVNEVIAVPDALTQEYTIVSADGGTTDNGLVLAETSPALHAMLSFPNPNDVVLSISVDFSNSNPNQTAIGDHLNASLAAGGGGLGPVMLGLLNTLGLEAYHNAIDQLSPEIYADTQIAALYASMDFSSNLLSCRVNGTDTASINREGQCLWVGAKARFLDSERTSQNIGYDESAGLFAAGAQMALDPVWRLGFGVGYQRSSLDTSTGAESDGDQVQGGIALKYNPGALLLAGVVSGGRGWYDTTRPMAFGGFAGTAQGDAEIDVLAGRLHASYVFGSPHFYYKPIIDAAVTRLDLSGVTEAGGGGASLVVHGDDHTVFSVSPALEFGTEWWLGNGTLVRPFVRTGVTWFSDDNVTVSASFAGTPAGVSPFTIRAEMDQVQADVQAGLEMINAEDSALRLYYDGHFGDTIKIQSVGLKGSAKF